MTLADRWLLPDGVEELLPAQAARAELLRRNLLDLYASWGYELVMPPLIEFTESLLVNSNRDLDLQTCKITDQLSGRTMGIRADITPQTARIDAHGLNREGVTRLCYAGSVLHAKPKNALCSRSPIQIGCELYGANGVDADCEVISLMIATAQAAGLSDITIDLGHVAIFRGLAALAGLDNSLEQELFDILQRKACTELAVFVAAHVAVPTAAGLLLALPQWKGDVGVLSAARQALAAAPAEVQAAIDRLQQIADCLNRRNPGVSLYFDLAELRGYHYHTGAVFALYVAGCGEAVANGGRYDDFGAAFGRARAASGFSADLKLLLDLGTTRTPKKPVIWVTLDDSAAQWQAIQALRQQGHCVITGVSGETRPTECSEILVQIDGRYQTQAV